MSKLILFAIYIILIILSSVILLFLNKNSKDYFELTDNLESALNDLYNYKGNIFYNEAPTALRYIYKNPNVAVSNINNYNSFPNESNFNYLAFRDRIKYILSVDYVDDTILLSSL